MNICAYKIFRTTILVGVLYCYVGTALALRLLDVELPTDGQNPLHYTIPVKVIPDNFSSFMVFLEGEDVFVASLYYEIRQVDRTRTEVIIEVPHVLRRERNLHVVVRYQGREEGRSYVLKPLKDYAQVTVSAKLNSFPPVTSVPRPVTSLPINNTTPSKAETDDALLYARALNLHTLEGYQAYLSDCDLCAYRHLVEDGLALVNQGLSLPAQRPSTRQDTDGKLTSAAAVAARARIDAERQQDSDLYLRAVNLDTLKAYEDYLKHCVTCDHRTKAVLKMSAASAAERSQKPAKIAATTPTSTQPRWRSGRRGDAGPVESVGVPSPAVTPTSVTSSAPSATEDDQFVFHAPQPESSASTSVAVEGDDFTFHDHARATPITSESEVEPVAAPTPKPKPKPVPTPKLTQTVASEPTSKPVPTPKPTQTVASEPTPKPKPVPTPKPTQTVASEPTPKPKPVPTPKPTQTVASEPTPKPVPTPKPAPTVAVESESKSALKPQVVGFDSDCREETVKRGTLLANLNRIIFRCGYALGKWPLINGSNYVDFRLDTDMPLSGRGDLASFLAFIESNFGFKARLRESTKVIDFQDLSSVRTEVDTAVVEAAPPQSATSVAAPTQLNREK